MLGLGKGIVLSNSAILIVNWLNLGGCKVSQEIYASSNHLPSTQSDQTNCLAIDPISHFLLHGMILHP